MCNLELCSNKVFPVSGKISMEFVRICENGKDTALLVV